MTATSLWRGSPLSRVVVDILTGGPQPRMADVVCVGQLWRRRRDGVVVVLRNAHRSERMVDASFVEAVDLAGFEATCWPLSFDVLRSDFDLLVSAENAR